MEIFACRAADSRKNLPMFSHLVMFFTQVTSMKISPIYSISTKDMAHHADTGARCLARAKRQRAGAVQDAGAKGPGTRKREASWTAVAIHRFFPRRVFPNIFQKTKSRYDL